MEIATEIQAAAIPHALAGRDILGAAKTGSGKTLSFVVPLLEKLYREHWTTDDGLAAIIITPTRELALQIFEVVRVVGKKHSLSAGLITGGKKEFEGEQERIVKMNILVATPGRLLQHFEQTQGFDASQLMVLVLDEADRILDMGFKQQLDGVLSYLPSYRQTMLFSATQTKSVKDLARLSLKNPQYLAVHAEDKEVTPKQLIQNYITVPLHEKLDVLFSFLRTHPTAKMIVFFSTCAQVRYVYELFRSMKPGIPLTALHGKIKQERRTLIYMDFLKRPSACMLATDIAARGLDFPDVDWVIQTDAPEDSAMYIHRVGRTARYNANGRALLMLMPQEEEYVVKNLHEATIPIKKLTVNPNQKFAVGGKAGALLAAFPEYRNYAKKAFVGYLRSLQLLPLYPIRDVKSLPLDEFSTSLGLPFTPEDVPVLASAANDVNQVREDIRGKKNVNRALDKLKKQIKESKEAKKRAREEAKQKGTVYVSDVSDDESSDEEDKKKKTKKDKFKLTTTNNVPKAKQDDDEDDDFLQVKQVHNWKDGEVGNSDDKNSSEEEDNIPVVDKVAAKPKKVKIDKDGKLRIKEGPKKVVFDEEGNAVDDSFNLVSIDDMKNGHDEMNQRIAKYAEQMKSKVDSGREQDTLREKQRLRDLRLKRKQDVRDKANPQGETAMLSFPQEEMSFHDDNEAQQSSSDSDSSDDSSDSGSDSNAINVGNKRRRDDDSSDDSDSDSDDSAVDLKKLKDQEKLAMEILEGKRPRK